jgi:hypothetical protein
MVITTSVRFNDVNHSGGPFILFLIILDLITASC